MLYRVSVQLKTVEVAFSGSKFCRRRKQPHECYKSDRISCGIFVPIALRTRARRRDRQYIKVVNGLIVTVSDYLHFVRVASFPVQSSPSSAFEIETRHRFPLCFTENYVFLSDDKMYIPCVEPVSFCLEILGKETKPDTERTLPISSG